MKGKERSKNLPRGTLSRTAEKGGERELLAMASRERVIKDGEKIIFLFGLRKKGKRRRQKGKEAKAKKTRKVNAEIFLFTLTSSLSDAFS